MYELASAINLHNLPREITPFIGRQTELEQLRQLISDDHTRLITILGMGGMGKTRLVQEAMRQQLGNFEDGVFIVPLANVSDPFNIPSSIASVIGLRFTTLDAPLEQLQNHLSQKKMLLGLDNFEHLVDSGLIVRNLLATSPSCKILVTSRQRLRLRDETLFNVTGMEIEAWTTLETAHESSVIQLFQLSAKRSKADFEVTADNLQQVKEICYLVQGMPLGVELAATWVNVLSLEEIAAQIKKGIDFLEAEFQDMPERHRSMRVVLEQSLNLLSPNEHKLFAQLCAFNGSFTLEAAKAIAGIDLRALTLMMTQALIQRDSQGRYTMHELLHQVGQEILQKDATAFNETCTRHAEFYCQILAGLGNAITFGDDPQAVCRQIDSELSNVFTALDWASQHGMFDEINGAVHTLMVFREYQNRFIEFSKINEVSIDHLRQFPPSARRDAALAHLLAWQAWTGLRFGRLEQGLGAAQESWNLLAGNNLNSTYSIGDPRLPLVIIQSLLGDLETARHVGQSILGFYTALQDFSGMGVAYFALSATELAAGNYEQVCRYGRQGYDALQRANYKYIQAYVLNNWGNAERALGNHEEAKRLFLESCQNMSVAGSVEGMAVARNHLAQIALWQHDYEYAWRIFEENLEIYRNNGDRGGLATTLEGLAQIAIYQKHHKQAAKVLREALDITGLDLGGITLSILTSIGHLFLDSGLLSVAQQVFSVVLIHPAANQEVKRKAQQLLQAENLETQLNVALPLEQLVSEAKRYLITVDWQSHANNSQLISALTEREMDVLQLLSQGASNHEIAEHLVMTVGTIKWYLNQIYSKLHVRNRTEAIIQARKLNLLS